MADADTTQTQTQAAAGTTQATQAAATTTPADTTTTEPGPIPYARFKEVNDTLAQLRGELQTLKTAQETEKQKQLADQGKWKELAEQREKDLNAERTERLRLKVASAKGIPAEFADRIKGSTEEEMAADADKVKALLKPAEGPGVPGTTNGGGSATTLKDIKDMTPAQVREAARKGQIKLK